MAIQFHPLKVKTFKQETVDTVSLTFEIPTHLQDELKYSAGQYLTIKVPADTLDNRRAYSISSTPFDGKDIKVTIKKVPEGLVSGYLNDKVKEGDTLEVMPPMGHFTLEQTKNSHNHNNFVFFAGGSGISPIYSMIKQALLSNIQSKCYLFYANRTEDNIIFDEEIKELQRANPKRFFVINSLSAPTESWQGLRGRFTAEVYYEELTKLLKDCKKADYFMCGPYGMMFSAVTALEQLGVSQTKIHKELFTAPIAEDGEESSKDNAAIAELLTRKVKIRIYGEDFEFDVDAGDTITSAAQQNGIDMPVSCQIGACSTCIAKVYSGEVIMDEREGLTDNEISRGLILACQAHPLTDNVFVDFDNL